MAADGAAFPPVKNFSHSVARHVRPRGKKAAAGTSPLPQTRELSYRGRQTPIPGVFPMDIAIMVLAVVFFFWQTISD